MNFENTEYNKHIKYNINKEDVVYCENCLNDSTTAKIIKYNNKNLCIECFNSLKYPRNFEKLKEEIINFLKDSNNYTNKRYPCILALSGGKDSIVSLYILVKQLKIRPLCITLDNNYLPKETIENCYNITKHLNVDWMILHRDFTQIFKNTILKGESPCRECSTKIMGEIRGVAKSLNINIIVSGHELPFGTSPFKQLKDNITLVRLLSGYNLTEKERINILKDLPWKNPNLGGYTTNCLVLAPALKKFYNIHNFNFEFKRICAMVRYGLMTKEEAKNNLKIPDVPEKIYDELKKRGLDLLVEKNE